VEREVNNILQISAGTDRAFKLLNDRRIVTHGAQDSSIPQSHLTEMHEAYEQPNEIASLTEALASL